MATVSRAKMILSEMNLRIHTNTYHRNQSPAPVRMARHEAIPPTYHSLMADVDGLSNPGDEDYSPQENIRMLAASRKASLEALKLYSGCFDFHPTPMERFCASSPSAPFGDVESLDASYVASEMRMITGTGCEADTCPGSPRPSSDTLSVSRYQEPRKERREHVVGRSRTRRRLQKSRRSLAHRIRGSFGTR
ncbi:unnamed protein product [Periconia digitata]|uniref:Uncharacterized protein n=1 Tax=Periconia digitata TaxID=1303443 RepID=A0A9W4UTX9_9PLEO|nr:unnamed protein product [Periconia digitata]